MITREVLKFPFSGIGLESEDLLSDKVISHLKKTSKKIIKTTKWMMVSLELSFSIFYGVIPVTPLNSIGLMIPRNISSRESSKLLLKLCRIN